MGKLGRGMQARSNLHLESRNETVRVEEAFDVGLVASRLENPIVVAGDLNTTPPGAPQSNASVDGRNAFEELVNANVLSYSPALAPSEAELTFPAFAPATTIDWVLFEEPALSLIQQKVIQTQLSDHLPVVAELCVER